MRFENWQLNTSYDWIELFSGDLYSNIVSIVCVTNYVVALLMNLLYIFLIKTEWINDYFDYTFFSLFCKVWFIM